MDRISFLGYEISDKKMSLRKYLEKKNEEIGLVKTINELERVIGTISYSYRESLKEGKNTGAIEKGFEGDKKG